jgi:hypothetical protein
MTEQKEMIQLLKELNTTLTRLEANFNNHAERDVEIHQDMKEAMKDLPMIRTKVEKHGLILKTIIWLSALVTTTLVPVVIKFFHPT